MRLIIGWHSDMLESEPIVFASIFHQHRTAMILGSGSDDAETQQQKISFLYLCMFAFARKLFNTTDE